MYMYTHVHTRRTKYEFQPRGGVEGVWEGGWRVGVSKELFGHFIFNFLCGRGLILPSYLKYICMSVSPSFFFSFLPSKCIVVI